MYPHDNIFNIYYNIGKRTPFLVKRCEQGLVRSSSEERRIDPNQDRTFLVETVKPRGKYGKAYGKCFVNGKPDDSYRQECYPNIKDEEIPCAGCGEWVLIDVPGVSLNEIFPMIYLCLGNIKVNLLAIFTKKIPSIFGGWKQLIGYSKLTLRS